MRWKPFDLPIGALLKPVEQRFMYQGMKATSLRVPLRNASICRFDADKVSRKKYLYITIMAPQPQTCARLKESSKLGAIPVYHSQ